jgi:hypothetical protein
MRIRLAHVSAPTAPNALDDLFAGGSHVADEAATS